MYVYEKTGAIAGCKMGIFRANIIEWTKFFQKFIHLKKLQF